MEPTNLTLYQSFDELDAWSNSLALAETDEERTEIQVRISEYLAGSKNKVDRFCQFLAHLDAQESLAKAEEQRLAERRKTIARVRERLEDYALFTMESTNRAKLEGNLSTLSTRARPASVEITAEEFIPEAYLRRKVTVDVDKRAIAEALKGGTEVPGARLRVGGRSLVRK